jgi:hypothetical protein
MLSQQATVLVWHSGCRKPPGPAITAAAAPGTAPRRRAQAPPPPLLLLPLPLQWPGGCTAIAPQPACTCCSGCWMAPLPANHAGSASGGAALASSVCSTCRLAASESYTGSVSCAAAYASAIPASLTRLLHRQYGLQVAQHLLHHPGPHGLKGRRQRSSHLPLPAACCSCHTVAAARGPSGAAASCRCCCSSPVKGSFRARLSKLPVPRCQVPDAGDERGLGCGRQLLCPLHLLLRESFHQGAHWLR